MFLFFVIVILIGSIVVYVMHANIRKTDIRDREHQDTIDLVCDYIEDYCELHKGCLYCSADYEAFLLVDVETGKLCEIAWGPDDYLGHRYIDDFYQTKTFLPLTQTRDMRGKVDPDRCAVFYVDHSALPNIEISYGQRELRGFSIDEKNMEICLIRLLNTGVEHRIIGFKDLIACDIVRDGESVIKTSRSSQVGGALVGGLLLGSTGAIIGGLSAKQQLSQEINSVTLRLTIDDIESPVYNYLLNTIPLKDDPVYAKQVEELALHWIKVMEVIIKRAERAG